jgi:hypothetical protein
MEAAQGSHKDSGREHGQNMLKAQQHKLARRGLIVGQVTHHIISSHCITPLVSPLRIDLALLGGLNDSAQASSAPPNRNRHAIHCMTKKEKPIRGSGKLSLMTWVKSVRFAANPYLTHITLLFGQRCVNLTKYFNQFVCTVLEAQSPA